MWSYLGLEVGAQVTAMGLPQRQGWGFPGEEQLMQTQGSRKYSLLLASGSCQPRKRLLEQMRKYTAAPEDTSAQEEGLRSQFAANIKHSLVVTSFCT